MDDLVGEQNVSNRRCDAEAPQRALERANLLRDNTAYADADGQGKWQNECPGHPVRRIVLSGNDGGIDACTKDGGPHGADESRSAARLGGVPFIFSCQSQANLLVAGRRCLSLRIPWQALAEAISWRYFGLPQGIWIHAAPY